MKSGLLISAATRGDLNEVNKLLKQQGVIVDEEDENGETPLHHAAMNNCDEVIAVLITAGANPKKENKDGVTPLNKAMQYGRKETIEALITNIADPTEQDDEGDSLIHYAACYGNCAAIEALVDKCGMGIMHQIQNKEGNTPLHDAVLHRDANAIDSLDEVIKALIQKVGCDPNVRNNEGNTPLHLAAEMQSKESIQALIDGLAFPDAQNNKNYNNTPLHIALDNRNLPASIVLIDAGADLSIVNTRGFTPLHVSALEGCVAIVAKIAERLSALGAAIDVKDEEGDTPLHHASHSDEEAGAAEVAAVLIKAGAKIDEKNGENKTPLDVAIEQEHPWVAEILFAKLYENKLADPIYVAMKKIYDDARPLWAKGSDDDRKALRESLLLANTVVQVMLDSNSLPVDKTKAVDALKQNVLTITQGKPSAWKKFIGALTALVGVAVLGLSIAGIPFTGGASLAGLCIAGGLFAVGGAAFFAHGMERGLSKDVSQLCEVATLKI